MNKPKSDMLYAKQQSSISKFQFDDKVADVFEDMISRSVPGYKDIIRMISVLSDKYLTPKTRGYDMGCSLGASSLAMLPSIVDKDCELVAVDNSEAMIQRCQKNLDNFGNSEKVSLRCEDIKDTPIENASFIVINFTLQFVAPENRETFLSKLYEGLNSGGALIISEKIIFESEEETKFQEELHRNFKKLNGYSDLEISQKRTALEEVLIPETLSQHRQRLKKIGFVDTQVWFQCFNFASFVTFKP